MKANLDSLREKFVGKVFGWLTVIDVFRDDNRHLLMFSCKCKCGKLKEVSKSNMLSGKTKSCGCYRYTEECREKQYAWYKDSEKVNLRNEKCKEWHIHNPYKAKETAEVNKQLRNSNPDKYKLVAMHIEQAHRKNRLKCDFSVLKDYVSDDTYNKLCSGDITTKDLIEIRCPVCNKVRLAALNNVFRIHKNALKNSDVPMCLQCRNSLYSSRYEQEIADYIATFYNGICIRNSRDIISPLELDLYYPEKKIAIEFNGDYWHDEDHKPRDYHYNKFKSCLGKGVLLVSIFESSWNTHSYNIKQYLNDLFLCKENKISFNNDMTLMNNNYPSPTRYQLISEHVDCYTTYKNRKVYQCGYSKLNV